MTARTTTSSGILPGTVITGDFTLPDRRNWWQRHAPACLGGHAPPARATSLVVLSVHPGEEPTAPPRNLFR
jgi:hypothetical protein